MSEELFSVIIPAYNSEAYIEEAIESVLCQQGVNLELIVVDDGSTDETVSIAKSFGQGLKVISQKNSGASTARNYGASMAKGQLLAFLDADDVWLPDKLRVQSQKIAEGYGMVYTNRLNIGEKGDLPDIQTDIENMPEGDIFEHLLLGNVITNSSVVLRRSIFRELNGFNANMLNCEDWELWLRCSTFNKIGYCPEPLVKYRLHSAAKSKNYKPQAEAREQIISSILASNRGKKLSDSFKRKIWARTFRTNAWCAAKSKDITFSMKWCFRALYMKPFEFNTWYDIARIIAGRV